MFNIKPTLQDSPLLKKKYDRVLVREILEDGIPEIPEKAQQLQDVSNDLAKLLSALVWNSISDESGDKVTSIDLRMAASAMETTKNYFIEMAESIEAEEDAKSESEEAAQANSAQANSAQAESSESEEAAQANSAQAESSND